MRRADLSLLLLLLLEAFTKPHEGRPLESCTV